MAVTEFGRLLRKLRIDHNEVLLNMADKLDISASYLSAMETHKRDVPEWCLKKIVELYGLSDHDAESLRDAANEQARVVRIPVEKMSKERKEIVFALVKGMNIDEILEKCKVLIASSQPRTAK